MTIENQKRLLHIVYGEKRDTWQLSELSCAKRLLALPGMTLDRVGLLMAIVSSSKHWESIIVSAEKLELHLDKLNGLLAKDPSAPGNRSGEEAYHSKPDTDDQVEWKKRTTAERAAKVEAVQKPLRELIAQARAKGLHGKDVGRWVFAERRRRAGEAAGDAPELLGAFVAQASQEQAAPAAPSRRGHIEPQRCGDARPPKIAEPEDRERPWYPDDEEAIGE